MHTESNTVTRTSSRLRESHAQSFDALILDARLRQSLVTVRSLGSRGFKPLALETFGGVPAFSSRWCQKKFICPADEGTAEYLAYLEQILDSTGARVLITSSDGTVALIRQYRDRLERRVSIALAKEPALEIAVNKEQTLEIARRLGLNVPRGVPINSVTEVKAALCEIGLPAVVKPVESWVGNDQGGMRFNPVLVNTTEEAYRGVEEMTDSGETVLFQQFLSGRREAVSFMYAHRKIYARFAQWAKRTNPPLGGTSVLRQSIAIPSDIGEKAENLVREIDLEGYSEVEFRRDNAGNSYLMEINPRLSASVEIAVRSGVDFPYLLYQWANGDPIDVVNGYQIGQWMRYLGGDISTTLAALRQRGRPGITSPTKAFYEFFASFFVPMSYDYVDWTDPLPMLPAMIDFFLSGAKVILKKKAW